MPCFYVKNSRTFFSLPGSHGSLNEAKFGLSTRRVSNKSAFTATRKIRGNWAQNFNHRDLVRYEKILLINTKYQNCAHRVRRRRL